jgi:hypothetical protein
LLENGFARLGVEVEASVRHPAVLRVERDAVAGAVGDKGNDLLDSPRAAHATVAIAGVPVSVVSGLYGHVSTTMKVYPSREARIARGGGKQAMNRIVLVLLLLTACSSGSGFSEVANSHTIHGTLTAPDCYGGYDIVNANVEVRDKNNKLIGSAVTEQQNAVAGECTASFTIRDVPETDFYQVKIGTHSGPSYTLAQMKASDWTLDLSLS